MDLVPILVPTLLNHAANSLASRAIALSQSASASRHLGKGRVARMKLWHHASAGPRVWHHRAFKASSCFRVALGLTPSSMFNPHRTQHGTRWQNASDSQAAYALPGLLCPLAPARPWPLCIPDDRSMDHLVPASSGRPSLTNCNPSSSSAMARLRYGTGASGASCTARV